MHVGAFQKGDLVSVWETVLAFHGTLCGLSWVLIAGGCWETLAQMFRSGGVGISSHALLVQRKGGGAMGGRDGERQTEHLWLFLLPSWPLSLGNKKAGV